MKIINEIELEKIIKLEKCYNVDINEISDEKLKKALVYYNFISNNIENLFLKEDKRSIMYSKYYWYTKYKERYFEVVGYDAGIEQEGFKLLEEIQNELKDGVDWGIIQEIEKNQK